VQQMWLFIFESDAISNRQITNNLPHQTKLVYFRITDIFMSQ